jgi:hypothetical protein
MWPGRGTASSMTERPHIVPPGTQIARYTPGSAVDLKVGAKIFIAAAQKQPDGVAHRTQRRRWSMFSSVDCREDCSRP